MKVVRIILILLAVVVPEWTYAQSFYSVYRERSIIVTAGSGTANYFGDMVNNGELGKIRYNIVLGAEYYLDQRISARAEFSYFQLAGDDALANDDRVIRNLSFTSGNMELSAVGTVSLFKLGQRYYQRPQLNIYGFAGVGLLYMNPKAERQNGEKVALRPLMTENVAYSRAQFVLPYGVGIKYAFHPHYNVIVEAGYRTTFTDYLDDVSVRRYIDPSLLSSDLSREMADRRRERDPDFSVEPGRGVRGNPENNDGYLLMNLKIQYYLPTQVAANYNHRKTFKRIKRGGQVGRPNRRSY